MAGPGFNFGGVTFSTVEGVSNHEFQVLTDKVAAIYLEHV